eukprot:snap_masked-scaffold_4-processed-gene-10.10-mRNA-1 protein AED:0.09 eAED:1.00 QI:0/-1/0/1/-1/1/1/0/234
MARKDRARERVGIGGGFPFIMLLAAVILLTASAIECSKGECIRDEEIAVGLSATLLVLNILYIIFDNSISATVNVVICVFFVFLWGFTAGYVTFEGPFLNPTNGYFAAWLGAVASVGLLAFYVSEAGTLGRNLSAYGLPILIIVFGSIVVIIAGVANGCCDTGDDKIALIGGSVSLVLALFRILLPGVVVVDYLLFLWWLIFGAILTFDVFVMASNGFFGAWACLLASAYLVGA